MSESVARIRITLNDIAPEIWRRVEVPLELSLQGLHDVIQAVMAWQDYHLFAFTIGEKVYGLPDPEWDYGRKIHKAKLAKLATFIAQGVDTFDYVYDMGDNWEHSITIEAVEPADSAQEYPRFIDGARRAPPEDVGGLPGYYEFMDAITKPRHREHKRMLEWYGGPYDPAVFETRALQLRLSEIAKRWRAGKVSSQKRLSN